MKMCTNCNKYPFCKKIQKASIENNCEEWVKRDISMKLNKVENGYFKFERVEED